MISQPTVSQQISNLESRLGQKLFNRKSKGVIETDFGRMLNTMLSGAMETLEEVAEQNRDIFMAAGGKKYVYIPALNDRPDHIDALVTLIERNLGNWLDVDPEQLKQRQEDARQRALAMGAPR